MTFDYDEFSDTMWVSLSEPASPCISVESQMPGVILRVEESTGVIRSFEVTVWSRRIGAGSILIPEVSDPEFKAEWLRSLSLMYRL